MVRRDLQREIVGRRISSAEVRDTNNSLRVIRRHASRAELEGPLAGASVHEVSRQGKYLVMHLGTGEALVVHLGMSGQLRHGDAGAGMAPHTHVVLDLAGGTQLRYVDPRAFGEMFLSRKSSRGTVPELAGLGPDPLGDQLDPERFAAILARHRVSMKALLGNQRLVAGIGNIYSDEMLFVAGVRPLRTSDSLSSGESRRLHAAMRQVLEAAIDHRGTSAADEQYRDLSGAVGGHGRFLAVYQREGRPCLRCGAPIQRARWANRSTFFCAACQQ